MQTTETQTQSFRHFEAQYLSLRQKEGRCYTDGEVRLLPEAGDQHPLRNEWRYRARSCKKLLNYLERKHKALDILEIGCGNGWLAHKLSGINQTNVTGIDINKTELLQARRVFARPNLSYFYSDLHSLASDQLFDIMVFAASFQYFPSAHETILACFDRLKAGGEIHILDTGFYDRKECAPAKERSIQYFQANGEAGMKDYYFHHSLDALRSFSPSLLYDPAFLINRVLKTTPFPWIRIYKPEAHS